MISVLDPDAARAALVEGRLRCPQEGCAGVLRPWSKARPRRVRVTDGDWVLLRPDRGLCRRCKVTQILLPAWCAPRRAYSVDVIGAALLVAAGGGTPAQAAAAVDAPVSTVRAWLRAVRDSATALSARAVTVAGWFGDAQACWVTRGGGPVSAIAAAVAALGGAARAWSISQSSYTATRVGTLSGIDYLATLVREYDRILLRRLRLPNTGEDVRGLSGWQMINIITLGRLLSTPAS